MNGFCKDKFPNGLTVYSTNVPVQKKLQCTFTTNFVLHGGYFHCSSNFMGNNILPSFSVVSFPPLVHDLIIPFFPLKQNKTASSFMFFHTFIYFVLSSPTLLSHPVVCLPCHHSSQLPHYGKIQFGSPFPHKSNTLYVTALCS